MVDEVKNRQMRRNEGIQKYEGPMHWDGQTFDQHMEQARANAMQTEEGRGYILNAQIAQQEAEIRRMEEQQQLQELIAQQEAELQRMIAEEEAKIKEQEEIMALQAAQEQEKVSLLYNTTPLEAIQMAVDEGLGVADNIKTLGLGAITTIFGSGVAGSKALLDVVFDVFTGYDTPDLGREMLEAADTISFLEDVAAPLVQPWTETGQRNLEMVGVPIMKVDDWVKDQSELLGAGYGVAGQTAAYTAINLIPDAVGLGVLKYVKTPSKAAVMSAHLDSIRRAAKNAGLDVTQENLADSIRTAALKRSRDTQGAAMGEVREALRAAREVSEVARDKALAGAQGKYAAMNANEVANMGKILEDTLRSEGFDIDKLPGHASALKDLQEIATRSPLTGKRAVADDVVADQAATQSSLILPEHLINKSKAAVKKSQEETLAGIDELWTIRNRIEKLRQKDAAVAHLPDSLNPNYVSGIMERTIDGWLMRSKVKGEMKGDLTAQAYWKKALNERQRHNRQFNHNDKWLYTLMDLDASATDMRTALLGAGKDPKTGSLARIRRLKEIIGEDHQVIRSLAMDQMHEIMLPLLKETGPDFVNFIKNYDNKYWKHAEVLDELGLDSEGLKAMRDFAHVAHNMPTRTPFITKDFLALFAARNTVGHGIARAGMKVNIVSAMLKRMMGKDVYTQRQILEAAADVRLGKPVFEKSNTGRVALTAAAIVADWEEIEELATR